MCSPTRSDTNPTVGQTVRHDPTLIRQSAKAMSRVSPPHMERVPSPPDMERGGRRSSSDETKGDETKGDERETLASLEDDDNPVPSILAAALKSHESAQPMTVKQALDFQVFDARPDSVLFAVTEVPNLFTFDVPSRKYTLRFVENERAYVANQDPDGPREIENEASPESAEREFIITRVASRKNREFKLVFNSITETRFGVNWAANVVVIPNGADEHNNDTRASRMIHLPGERTYDPAGMSDDPHQSERVGGSCAKTQLMITIAELHALKFGATPEQVKREIQDVFEPIIARYHGRLTMFEYMWHQIEQIWHHQTPLSYPAFVARQVCQGRLNIQHPERMHTRKFLASFYAGEPKPPIEYFRKLAESPGDERMSARLERWACRQPEFEDDNIFKAVWRRDFKRIDEFIARGDVDKQARKFELKERVLTAPNEAVRDAANYKVVATLRGCTALHVAVHGLVRPRSLEDDRIFFQNVEVVLKLLDADILVRADKDKQWPGKMLFDLLEEHYAEVEIRGEKRSLPTIDWYVRRFARVHCSS